MAFVLAKVQPRSSDWRMSNIPQNYTLLYQATQTETICLRCTIPDQSLRETFSKKRTSEWLSLTPLEQKRQTSKNS